MPKWTADARADVDRNEALADLPHFARTCLKIRPKAGGVVPFSFNPAQLELHRKLEEQKAKTGKVRAVILKSRQLGVSTYVAARFYHRTIRNPGTRCLIVGHEKRASTNLYQMVRRFHDLMPEEMKPSVGTSNAEELIFDKLDSGYLVTVATGEGAGRSATVQNLHASETAFWPNLAEQFAGLAQTVPDIDDTEVIIETTALGYNEFYSFWRKAEAGGSEFVPVFLPWKSDPGYRARLPEGFEMTSEERALAEVHELDAEQICWRRNKISQLPAPELFPQEYPITPDEAFVSDNFDSFIPAALVLQARKQEVEEYGPLIVSCDPASKGADSTAFAWRRGHAVLKTERRRGIDLMEIAGRLSQIIREEKPERVAIDITGLGVGVYDRLCEMGHRDRVLGVNFAGKPIEPPPLGEDGKPAGGPANRRAEIWNNLKEALEEGRLSLPDDNDLQADLVSVGYKYTSDGRLLLESKEDMRRRGVPSPDLADAVALLFCEPGGDAFPRVSNFNRKIEYTNYVY
jgi:hypothetical protein